MDLPTSFKVAPGSLDLSAQGQAYIHTYEVLTTLYQVGGWRYACVARHLGVELSFQFPRNAMSLDLIHLL
jgi:hypothetical protein